MSPHLQQPDVSWSESLESVEHLWACLRISLRTEGFQKFPVCADLFLLDSQGGKPTDRGNVLLCVCGHAAL